MFEEALTIYQAVYGQDHLRTMEATTALGTCLTALARYDEAEPLLLESLTFYQEKQKDDQVKTTRQKLFDLYTAWGKPEQAAAYRGDTSP